MTLLFGRATINDHFQSKTHKMCDFLKFDFFLLLYEIMYSRVSLSAHTKFCPNVTRFSYKLHGSLEGRNTNYVPVGEDL
jgi:hypothetical protein